MSRQIEKRLRKLEGGKGDTPEGVILVRIAAPYADDIEINAEIDAMIARGEITEADRPQCVSWWKIPNREFDDWLTRVMREIDGKPGSRGLPIRK